MEPSDPPDREPDGLEATIINRARDRLIGGGYSELARIVVSYRRGILRLRGRLSSQYLKQVAQELVLGIEGINAVVNEIEVRVAADRGRSGTGARRPAPEARPSPSDRAPGDPTPGG